MLINHAIFNCRRGNFFKDGVIADFLDTVEKNEVGNVVWLQSILSNLIIQTISSLNVAIAELCLHKDVVCVNIRLESVFKHLSQELLRLNIRWNRVEYLV